MDDFAWTLRSEFDYVREGRNADRLREILANQPAIVVPAVCWAMTTKRVLVMERIDGVRLADSRALPPGTDPVALALAGAEAMLTQVFEAGFFHADPHPGNFLVTDDGRLALLDFGMVGYLDDELRFRCSPCGRHRKAGRESVQPCSASARPSASSRAVSAGSATPEEEPMTPTASLIVDAPLRCRLVPSGGRLMVHRHSASSLVAVRLWEPHALQIG